MESPDPRHVRLSTPIRPGLIWVGVSRARETNSTVHLFFLFFYLYILNFVIYLINPALSYLRNISFKFNSFCYVFFLLTITQEFLSCSPSTAELTSMYKLLNTDNITRIFPNVEIAMRIFLTILPTNCSGERSFSRLSLIKYEHRSTMTQKKLNKYSVMCIENDLLKTIEFEEIINEFVSRKMRRECI